MSQKTALNGKKTPYSPSLKLPKDGMDAVCFQFRSFCNAKTPSLKTAWMRFLSNDPGDRRQATGDRRQATGDRRQATGDRRQATGDRRQATGNYTHLLNSSVNYTNRLNSSLSYFYLSIPHQGFIPLAVRTSG
jgi:hypothetical protein